MFFYKKLCVLCTGILALGACSKVEFSPNQKFDKHSPVNVNQINLDRLLKTKDQDDTLRFALTGDTQRSYDNARDVVNKINRMKGIDFVVIGGDISDFGLLQEFEDVEKIYSNLTVPFVGIIGNHDLQAKGSDVFQRMYGKLNYSFVYDSIKFVCHDTNSREYNFDSHAPDLEWLKGEFAPTAGVKAFIALGHVPPFADDFNKEILSQYLTILTSVNLLGAGYAHINEASVYYYSSVNAPTPNRFNTLQSGQPLPPFLVTNAIQNREFRIIEVVHGKLNTQSVKY